MEREAQKVTSFPLVEEWIFCSDQEWPWYQPYPYYTAIYSVWIA